MTIIYSNAEDIDCHVLRYAFENLKDVNLVEIDKSSVNWAVHVNEAISKEEKLNKLTELFVEKYNIKTAISVSVQNENINFYKNYGSAMDYFKWT